MGPLKHLTQEEMIRFFHCKKTEISCIEEPHTFLNQLRDHNLVPEDLYKKVANMKSKERKQKGVYHILERLEKERGECIKLFWSCVFQDPILKKYTIFRSLKKSFHDGSFRICENVPNTEKPNSNKGVEREDKTHEEKKRKKNCEETDEEEPGPSSMTNQKKPKEVTFCVFGMHKKIPNSVKPSRNKEADRDKKKQKEKCTTKQKKSGKESVYLPCNDLSCLLPTSLTKEERLNITCGDKEGILYPGKLDREAKCILSQGQWFTASEFEKFSGKGNNKNWKLSIRWRNIPLKKLLKDGHLQYPQKDNKSGMKKLK